MDGTEGMPKRRWFAFSLQKLFILVTLAGCWLGYQVKWIKDRHSFLSSSDWSRGNSSRHFVGETTPPAPWSLRLLGEKCDVNRIFLPREVSDTELARVRGLFPEKYVFPQPERWVTYAKVDEREEDLFREFAKREQISPADH
jgi:hypothetical protein